MLDPSVAQKKVFLTGGTGFLGMELLKQLLRAEYCVRALARRPAGIEPGRLLEVVQGDLSDGARLAEQMKGCGAVLHAAALVSAWAPDEREFYRVNVEGFRNVLEATEKSGAEVLLYTSTFFALGPSGLPGVTETSGLSALRRHPYQHSKFLARLEARQALSSGFPVVILYPGVIYGPGRKTQGNVVVRIIEDFVAGRIPGVLGDGSQIWSYSYVEDVARGHLLALERCSSGAEYVLGGDNVSFGEFFKILGRLVGRPAPRFRIPLTLGMLMGGVELLLARVARRLPKMTPSTVRMMGESWACDSARARRDLGYQSRSLEQGLRATLQWLGVPTMN